MLDDTISRQMAIDAHAKAMPSLTTPDGCGQFDHDIYIAQETFVDSMQIIADLPSAEQWTPVADGFPEIGDRTLVTIPSIGEKFVTIGTYAGEYRWYISDYGFCEKVIAWMSLPEPYKGGDEE